MCDDGARNPIDAVGREIEVYICGHEEIIASPPTALALESRMRNQTDTQCCTGRVWEYLGGSGDCRAQRKLI